MGPAVDLRDYLVAQAVSSAATTFYGEMPADPQELTVVRDTPGFPAFEFMGGSPDVQNATVMVSVRAASYAAAQTRAYAVHAALRAISHTTINTRRYLSVIPQGLPTLLNRDEASITASGSEGRPIFVFFAQVMRDGA